MIMYTCIVMFDQKTEKHNYMLFVHIHLTIKDGSWSKYFT